MLQKAVKLAKKKERKEKSGFKLLESLFEINRHGMEPLFQRHLNKTETAEIS